MEKVKIYVELDKETEKVSIDSSASAQETAEILLNVAYSILEEHGVDLETILESIEKDDDTTNEEE